MVGAEAHQTGGLLAHGGAAVDAAHLAGKLGAVPGSAEGAGYARLAVVDGRIWCPLDGTWWTPSDYFEHYEADPFSLVATRFR